MKRLGEITSEKILDFENNINALARMREYEDNNFDMEKDKIINTRDFVTEQMKVHFFERALKLEDITKTVQMDQQK